MDHAVEAWGVEIVQNYVSVHVDGDADVSGCLEGDVLQLVQEKVGDVGVGDRDGFRVVITVCLQAFEIVQEVGGAGFRMERDPVFDDVFESRTGLDDEVRHLREGDIGA